MRYGPLVSQKHVNKKMNLTKWVIGQIKNNTQNVNKQGKCLVSKA